MKITANKIWFSKDPSLFLPQKYQDKLIRLKAENDADFGVRLIIWKELLNADALQAAQAYQLEQGIEIIDLDNLVLARDRYKEAPLVDVAKLELRAWLANEGGNPAVASDIIRCLSSVLIKDAKSLNYYSDLDFTTENDQAILSKIKLGSKFVFHVTYDKEGNINFINNDVLYFSQASQAKQFQDIIYNRIFYYNYQPNKMSEALLRSHLNFFPYENLYAALTTDDFFKKNYAFNSSLSQRAFSVIAKREILLNLISPKQSSDDILAICRAPLLSEYMSSVIGYCGPEALSKFIATIASKEIASIDRPMATKTSWHPLRNFLVQKKYSLISAFKRSLDCQNFIKRIDHVFNKIGQHFFSDPDMKNLLESSCSKEEFGKVLYRYKSLLTREAIKFLFEILESNQFNTDRHYNFQWPEFNDRLLKNTSPFNGLTYESVFNSVCVLHDNKHFSTLTEWLFQQNQDCEERLQLKAIAERLGALIIKDDNLETFLGVLEESPQIKNKLETTLITTDFGEMNLFYLSLAYTRNNIALYLVTFVKEPNTLFLGQSLLWQASFAGMSEIVLRLLLKGANVNQSFKGATPFYVAVQEKHQNCAKILADFGADINAHCNEFSPLDCAIVDHNPTLFIWLYRIGCKQRTELQETDQLFFNIYLYTLLEPNLAKLQNIVTSSVELKQVFFSVVGYSLCQEVINAKIEDIALFFLSELNNCSTEQKTDLLINATINGLVSVMKKLLDEGVDPNRTTQLSILPPLSHAILNNNRNAINLLRQYGSRLPKTESDYDFTNLFFAAYDDKWSVFQTLKQSYVTSFINGNALEQYLAALEMWSYLDDILPMPEISAEQISQIQHPIVVKGLAEENLKKHFASTLKNKWPDEIVTVFSNIFVLLNDNALCCSLLKELDSNLAQVLSSHKIELPQTSEAETYYNIYHLFYPKNYNGLLPRKHGLLNQTLLRLENEFGINLKSGEIDPVAIFSRMIKPEKAKKFIEEGGLFTEDSLSGNTSIYGKYIHRLRWHIIMQAIKNNYLSIAPFTVKDLLKYSVAEGAEIWANLLDSVYIVINSDANLNQKQGHIRAQFGLHGPHNSNSFFLSTERDEIKNISNYLRCSFWNSLTKIKEKAPHQSYEQILKTLVASQMLTSLPDAIYGLKRKRPNDVINDSGLIRKKLK